MRQDVKLEIQLEYSDMLNEHLGGDWTPSNGWN